MRKVQVEGHGYIYDGYFHGWDNEGYAIVENSEGKILLEKPMRIKFLDKESK